MLMRRILELFESYDKFRDFKRTLPEIPPLPLDSQGMTQRAIELAEKYEPRSDRSELKRALAELEVSFDPIIFGQKRAILDFLSGAFFIDVSRPVSPAIINKIDGFKGPKFFFVGHSSFFDYILAVRLIRHLGLTEPVIHASGAVTLGWVSRLLKGFRSLKLAKSFSPLQHRAYAWYCAALAERNETQALFARTSRYMVRSRDGVLREPYVPHGILAAVKATGRALVTPVAISYSIIPEDRFLVSPNFFPVLSMFRDGRNHLARLLLGIGPAEKTFGGLSGIFGELSVDVGDPFELNDDDSLSSQRIAHRAIEEIARNKMVHPSQLVAKALQGRDSVDKRTLRELAEREINNIRLLFRTRYHREAPLNPLIMSDLPEAIEKGLRDLTARRAVRKTLFRRGYSANNPSLLSFYAYHADRRIYPLSGKNTMTVVNAGVWGYTLALHIGANLLRNEKLSEQSVILYDSREDLIEKLTVDGRHPWHFRDIRIPRTVRPEADLRAAVGDTSLILIVTPSKYYHSTLVKVLELAPDGADLVIATKGFIPETGLLPCQTARLEMERLGKRISISVLSGANLAHEIVQGGAGVTQIACEQYQTFERLRPLLETRMFRVVYSADVIGTTISAALKNVYAIGFGILEGSKMAPENFLATFATLATAEIRTFGILLGALPETFDAESQVWMADLLATCRGGRSSQFGKDLVQMDEKHGKARAAWALMEQYSKKRIAVEGFEAARFAQRMASQRGFHPPILGEIYSILHGGKQVEVDAFIEKCLDALGQRNMYPLSATFRSRPMK
jgi:glycerol-3-phosphate dehydrogenase